MIRLWICLSDYTVLHYYTILHKKKKKIRLHTKDLWKKEGYATKNVLTGWYYNKYNRICVLLFGHGTYYILITITFIKKDTKIYVSNIFFLDQTFFIKYSKIVYNIYFVLKKYV